MDAFRKRGELFACRAFQQQEFSKHGPPPECTWCHDKVCRQQLAREINRSCDSLCTSLAPSPCNNHLANTVFRDVHTTRIQADVFTNHYQQCWALSCLWSRRKCDCTVIGWWYIAAEAHHSTQMFSARYSYLHHLKAWESKGAPAQCLPPLKKRPNKAQLRDNGD